MLGSMSLDVSTELEARILAKAERLGLPVGVFLELVLSENEEFAASLNQADSALKPLSPGEVEEKIGRGLAQLERGECVDGEQFMADLLSGINQRRAG